MYASRVSTHVKVGYLFAVALWCASLVLPAAELNGSMRLLGSRVFMIGIDALGSGMPGWLANPLSLVAIATGLWRRFVAATLLSCVACVVMLSSFYAPTLAASSGLPIDQVDFKIGFYLWLAACSMILTTSAYALLVTRRCRD
jgi:hypothetical protein